MQIHLLPELPTVGGYEKITTAFAVFSRHAIAYPVASPTAVNTAKDTFGNLTEHAYILMELITDKDSVLFSNVVHEVADVLGIKIRYATTKRSQKIRVLERKHATMKTSLKSSSGEFCKQWH